MIGIYKWTSPSGKIYIGQSKNLERRKKEFLTNPFKYEYCEFNTAIDKARRKYNDFSLWKYEILKVCKEDELNKLEQEFIEIFETTNSQKGYNSTKGGEGSVGTKWGSEKQKEALKNRKSYKGENGPMYGKHHSEEAKEKISKANKGRKHSVEVKIKKSKPVLQFDLDGNLIKEWYGATEAMNQLGIDKTLIGKVCKGIKKTAGGFKWSYK